MAKNLTARFSLVDEMSAKMSQISNAGVRMLDSWKSASDSVGSGMGSVDAATSSASRSINEITGSMTSLESVSSDASDALDSTTASIEEVTGALGDAGNASNMAGEDMEEFGKTGVQAVEAVGAALVSAGIIKMVTDIAQVFLAAAECAEKFETSVAQLETIAGAQNIGVLKEDINALSAETGIAAGDLALVAYNAISAGTAVEDAVGMAEAASKLATAGFTDSGSALSVLTTATNAYGDAAGTATEISDSLITVQNLGVTTVADLASTMGKAIATASAYNVSLGNLESAYISTTKAGINTMESTTYISSMLKELGSAGTEVSDILSEHTGQSFGQLMASGASLADVLQILYQSTNENAEAMMNLWGSAEAGKAANALLSQGLDSFNANLEAVQNSAGATESAYAIMANTTEYAHQRMINSVQNLGIAIGETLNPGLEKGYNLVTNLTTGVTSFVQKHPTVVKACTAIAVGVGVATVAIVAVGVATSAAGKAIVATIATINTAMGPVGWAIMAVTALTAGIVAFGAMLGDTTAEVDTLTEASREQYLELERLNSEYDAAVEAFGETSDEALSLRYEIDSLSEAYENSRQTMEEFQQETQDLCDAMDEVSGNYKDAMKEISKSEQGDLALIRRLQELEDQEVRTAAETEEMIRLIQRLNQDVPGLNISYEDLANGTGNYAEAIKAVVAAEYERQKTQEQQQAYTDALQTQYELEEQLREAMLGRQKIMEQMGFTFDVDAADAETEMADLIQKYDNNEGFSFKFTGEEVVGRDSAYGDRLAQYEDDITELISKWQEAEGIITECEDAFERASRTITEGADAQTQAMEAVSYALTDVQDELNTLCEAYDAAYEAARESFDGQFGLFDQAEEDASATVSAAQDALNSQLAYWTNYSSNVAQLSQLTVDQLNSVMGAQQITQEQMDSFMSYVQSGTEEAAGMAASMVEAMESGNTAAIGNLIATHAEIQAKQEEAAQNIASWQTDFEAKLEEIYTQMSKTVDELDLSSEAQASATATMQSYIQSIQAAQGSAVAAAQSIATAVANALSANASLNLNVNASLPGNADGTLNAQKAFIAGEEGTELIANAYASGTTNARGDFYLAGEKGPELIVGREGSTVFPHSETEKLMEFLNDSMGRYALDSNSDTFYMRPESLSSQAVTDPSWSNRAQYRGDMPDGDSFFGGNAMGEHGTSTLRGSADGQAVEEKRIVLEINGTGNIGISKNMDQDRVVEILQNNMKPILYALLSEEIFEEGRLSYEY